MRRATALAAVLIAIAVGCGGDDDAASPLDEALGYLPADSALVVAVSTDLDGDQYRAVSSIVDRFPFGAQVKEAIRTQIEEGGEVDFDADVRPLLGNEFVVGVAEPEGLEDEAETQLAVIQVADADRAQELIEGEPGTEEVADAGEATVYETDDGTAVALRDDVLLTAGSREQIDAALAQRESEDRLTEEEFEAGLTDLPEDALVRVYGDLEAILASDPEAERALAAPWVGALRTFGATASASDDGISAEFSVTTDPAGLTEEDLPLAAGPTAPPVTATEGQVAAGIRDPSQIFDFAEATGEAVNPDEFDQYEKDKQKLGRRLGVDLDRDVIGQLSEDATLSFAPNGSFGFRSELADPDEFERTLERLAGQLPDVAKEFGGDFPAIAKPRRGEDFYAISEADGESAVFGVIDDAFVVARDPGVAGQLAAGDPATVPGAVGSVSMRADAEVLANEIAKEEAQELGDLGVEGFTGPLADLTGSLESETDGLHGRLSLGIE